MKAKLYVEPVSFQELKRLYKKRIFAIPKIQREFVWTKGKIIDLLDSIKKHYPIGSFLICKIPSNKSINIKERGTTLPLYNQRNKMCYLVIDGQQRLSVIYAALFGAKIKSRRYQEDIESKNICLAQRSETESAFEFYDVSGKDYVSLYDVLENANLRNNKKRGLARECRKAFEDYSFPFIFINGFDEKKMKQAFTRLNRGGTHLSTEDKFFAESFHKDCDIRSHVNNLIDFDLKNGFQNIESKHIIKSILANLGEKDFVGSGVKYLAKELGNPRNEKHILYIKNHKKIEHAITKAADFLISKFQNASYIPYPAMLSILSVFYYNNGLAKPDSNQKKEIMRWFWITAFTERYSGKKQKSNQLKDAEEMRKLATHTNHKLNLEDKQRKSDTISVSYLLENIKYHSRGALRNAFFCYLINKEPREFKSGDPITVGEVSSIFNSKNDHHIFPKELLQNEGHYLDDINRLGNICFLTFDENIRISDDPPWLYLKPYSKKNDFRKTLSSHAIFYDSSILKPGDITKKYERFLEKRKFLVKKDLTKMLGPKYVVE